MEKIKPSLYSPEIYRKCLERIEKLTPNTKAQWGKMNPAQMLAHCAEIQEVSTGKPLENTPFAVKLFKGVIRKMVVGDKPYPKSSKTHPQFEQNFTCDFETEKQRLLKVMEEFVNADIERVLEIRHPLFGKMTLDEKGWVSYKHLDHHLSQFGL